jgi:hypothetical protein
MISLTALENRAIFDAIHAVVGMALDTPQKLYSPYCGICKNVQCWLREYQPDFQHLAYSTLSKIFVDMGLAEDFPIPYIPAAGGSGAYPYWTGEYLRLRMDLCSKLMSYLDINLVHTIFSEQHDELLPALKALAFLPSSAMPWPYMGICANVEALMTESSSDFVYSELEYIFAEMGFPDPRQPIEYGFDDKWEGSAGIARRKLLADLIKHLEAKNVSTT